MPKLTLKSSIALAKNIESAFTEKLAEQMVEVVGASLEDTLSENHFPPASAPGEVPHRRTGRLATSWFVVASANGAALRSSAPYASFLQQGTDRMEARPYLERAFADAIARLKFNNAEFRDIIETR